VPSLALGSSEVTLMELVRAYGVLAAGGGLAPTRAVLGRARYGGQLTRVESVEAAPVIDPAVAYLVTSTLEGVVTRGTGRALNEDGRFGSIAGKTGTFERLARRVVPRLFANTGGRGVGRVRRRPEPASDRRRRGAAHCGAGSWPRPDRTMCSARSRSPRESAKAT
jgi:hypothetical protein